MTTHLSGASPHRQTDFYNLFTQHTEAVPPELLQRYNLSGPRYTSYPTAPVWTEAFTASDLTTVLAEKKQSTLLQQTPFSLYVHLPFCESRCLFCGCNVVITKQTQHAETYLGYLFKEMELLIPQLDTTRPVVQIHYGGGTPTYLTPEQLSRVTERLKQSFNVAPDAEISIECDPRVTTTEQLATLRSLGFNRISLGVQDVDTKVQHTINRIQPLEQTAALIESARELGFDGVNVDLIYGLPFQTPESFKATIEAILPLSPDRLAVYNYAHVPWMAPHQKQMPEEALPAGELKYQMFKQTTRMLLEAGYVYIGMDHFAKPNDELAKAWDATTLHRNFQGYTTRAGQAELVGMGLSSISSWEGHFSQNLKKLSTYYTALDAGTLPTWRGYALSDDDKIRRTVISRLMCDNRLNFESIEQQFGIVFDTYFADALEGLKPLLADGLATLEADVLEFTPLGRIFSRNIAMCFDAYLPQPNQTNTAEKPTALFSKTL